MKPIDKHTAATQTPIGVSLLMGVIVLAACSIIALGAYTVVQTIREYAATVPAISHITEKKQIPQNNVIRISTCLQDTITGTNTTTYALDTTIVQTELTAEKTPCIQIEDAEHIIIDCQYNDIIFAAENTAIMQIASSTNITITRCILNPTVGTAIRIKNSKHIILEDNVVLGETPNELETSIQGIESINSTLTMNNNKLCGTFQPAMILESTDGNTESMNYIEGDIIRIQAPHGWPEEEKDMKANCELAANTTEELPSE